MIRVRQIKVPVLEDSRESLFRKISKKMNISSSDILNYQIIKKSIDARNKSQIFYVYEVDVEVLNEKLVLKKNKSKDIFLSPKEKYQFKIIDTKKLKERPIIVGSGPAGLFCGYLLAEAGYKPLIIEQGEMIEERIKSVERFFEDHILNPTSNIQFGEGGAGTFSDGKLNTLVKDKACRGKKVFEIFVENGAPEEIMYLSHPHIGTDILRKVIVNIRNNIISMGGEFLFKTKLTDLIIKDDVVKGIVVNEYEEIPCNILVLALGHSARDTFYMLHDRKMKMKSKNFAVGLRIEHPKEMINESQYGKFASVLPTAAYKLTHKSSTGRGVYSFCMCPGGYVVNASSEEKRLVVNGMSNYKRDARNSNSAIVVTVSSQDFGEELFSGMEFQRRIEEKAYKLGDGLIPIQLFGDFKNKKKSTKFGEIIPNTMGDYQLSSLHNIYSTEITDSIEEGILAFDKKIKGFAREDAVLLGVETRTSSPIIIERDEKLESNIKGIYPCGEGAGYAGGITTAAIDGIKVAEKIVTSL